MFGLIVFPHSSFVFSVPFKNDRSRFHCTYFRNLIYNSKTVIDVRILLRHM